MAGFMVSPLRAELRNCPRFLIQIIFQKHIGDFATLWVSDKRVNVRNQTKAHKACLYQTGSWEPGEGSDFLEIWDGGV